MSDKEREQIFLEQTKKTLNDSLDALDSRTLSRLASARKDALHSTGSKIVSPWRWMRVPAAAFLMAALFFLISTFYVSTPNGIPAFNRPEDIEILTAAEPPEFYSNLDFYFWLAEVEENAG